MSIVITNLRARLPNWDQILPVYSVIVVILYTWSTVWFFYRASSWALFLNISEILAVYSYVLAANFLESILAFVVILGMCFILPFRWFLERFVYRGASFAILGLGFMMYFAKQLQSDGMDKFPGALLNWSPLILFGIFLSVFLLEIIPGFSKMIAVLADRSIVFMYLYLPLTVIAVISIVVRVFI